VRSIGVRSPVWKARGETFTGPELAALAGADAELLRAALRVPLQAKGHKTARAQLAALVTPKR
jgi:hypothetical protein